MAKLRKVIFWKQLQDGYHPDLSKEEIATNEDNTREREGLFHCWTPALKHSPELGEKIPCMAALIEEESTSAMYELTIEYFRFVHPAEYVER